MYHIRMKIMFVMKKKPIFTTPFFDFEIVDENNNKAIQLYSRITKTKDDRSKVILAGIIVEYYLDRLLKCFFVDYKNLTDRTDYTFSLKISILKSMQLIPNEIVLMCDIVRKIRNTFAHNFDIDKIEHIDKKLITNLIQLYKTHINKNDEISLINMFNGIYNCGHGYLRSYEKNVKLLRKKIDSPDFEKELDNLNQKQMTLFYKKVQENNPTKVIDLGNGMIEEQYPYSFGIVKKKR